MMIEIAVLTTRKSGAIGLIQSSSSRRTGGAAVCLLWLMAMISNAETLAAAPAAKPGSHPNIVLILADDLGYGDVSCYNRDSKVPTPAIDRLASEGLRFTDAYAPAAVCVPTRYGLLTGRYPFRQKIKLPQSAIDEGRLTLGSILKKRGYATACVGKWHLGFDNGLECDASPLSGGPTDRGFDSYFGLHASLDIPPYFYIRNNRCVAVPSGTTPGSTEAGLSSQYQGRFWRPGSIAPGFHHEEVLDRLTDEAVDFLRRRKATSSTKPFFLYFALTAPHGPWLASESHRGQSTIGAYGDFILHVDAAIGRVLEALQPLDHEVHETLVILTSDNGPLWFDADVERSGHSASYEFRGRKGDIWEGGVRIPFLVRWPGRVSANSVSREIVGLTDLLATFAAIVDEPLPDDAGEDSCNLLPAFLGTTDRRQARDSIIVQSVGETKLAIREERWKLIPWLGSGGFLTEPRSVSPEPGGPTGQLYDLEADPQEQHNLFQDHPEVVTRLATLLEVCKRQGHSRRIIQPD